MPEIWLRYGTTDVVLDIRFENLSGKVSTVLKSLPEQEIRASIATVPLTDNMLVIALSGSKAAGKVVSILAELAREKGFNLTIDAPQRATGALRANMAGNDTVPINRIDYHSLKDRMSRFHNTVIISKVTVDPLFGFAGAPTVLARNFLSESMTEAFKARKNNRPAPGVRGEPLKVITSAVAEIPATSVELLANSDSIAEIYTGNINEAFDKAVSGLQTAASVETDPVKCAIISASSEAGTHSTLGESLNSLWNTVHAVNEGGSAILISENREGVGGGALQMFIEGRLKQEQVQQQSLYIDGIEHLLFIEELRQKYGLGLVSTLPRYYAGTKLGFSIYTSMKEILEKLPEKHGKNFKALIISDADMILLKPRA